MSHPANVTVVNHPLILDKLSHMRDAGTPTIEFRRLLREIALLMGYEVTRHLPLEMRSCTTPLQVMEAPYVRQGVVIVPILRAGLGMSGGLYELIPNAREGHIGLYRHPETHRPVEYVVKLPEGADDIYIVVDPMIATGHSAAYAVDVLNKRGISDERIMMMALVAAPEGLAVFADEHPKVPVYVASVDDRLNDHDYILPGLGDAGDRLFGTK